MIEIVNKKIPVVQLCFSLEGMTFSKIRKKLIEAKGKLDSCYAGKPYLVKSCHLSRDICKSAGITTELADIFDEVFGDAYECQLTEKTLQEANANMDRHRRELAAEADRLVILSETEIGNVKLEVELFTESRLMVV